MQLISSELKEKSIMRFEVEVSLEKVEEALIRSYRKVNQRLTVPGFRRGKATRAMLERRYGPEIFYEDAIDFLLPDVYEWLLEEHKPQVLDRPSYDVAKFERGEPATFVFEVAVKPEVVLGEYKGVAAYKKVPIIGDDDVLEELKQQQEEHARLVTISEGMAEEGDTVTLDYEGFVDDEPFEGGQGENYSLLLGSGRFIPGFEEELIGSPIGVALEVKVTFPADYRAEHLAGKDALFRCLMKEAKRKQLLPIDDEFAQEISEFETIDELKADLLQTLTKRAEEEAENDFRNAILTKIIKATEIDLPVVIIEREIDRLTQNFAYNIGRQGLRLEDYLRVIGKEMEEFRSDFEEFAITAAKRTLTLDAIAVAEEIVPSDEDMDAYFAESATALGVEDIEDLKSRIKADENHYEECLEDVRIKKALDLLALHSITLDEPEIEENDQALEIDEEEPKEDEEVDSTLES